MYERSEAALGVDHSMRYSMHTLCAPNEGGTIGDVGDKMAKPRNINVRINVARSGRSFSNTYVNQLKTRLKNKIDERFKVT